MSREWRERAACQGADPALFEQGDNLSAARRVCGMCPVRTDCLADALRLRDREGFRAGLTGDERAQMLPRHRREPTPVEEIVRLRNDLRWSVKAVTVALGVSRCVVHQVVSRDRKPAVTAPRKPRYVTVSTVGVVRRRQALGAAGYTLQDIAARMGVTYSAVLTALQKDHIEQSRYERWCRVYDELAAVPGASAWTRAVAARMTWAPPEAWTVDTIDDPDAQPDWAAVAGGAAA
jgi:hypothetical protein